MHNYLIPHYIPTSQEDPPAWELVPKLREALEERDKLKGFHVDKALEEFVPTINAFASICVPADPATVAAFGVADSAAGELARDLGDGNTDPFGRQVVRLYESVSDPADGTPAATGCPFDLNFSAHDGLCLFWELDLHAQAQGAADFADLYATNQAAAEAIVADFAAGTAQILDPATGSSAALQAFFILGNYVVQLCYYTNFPEHRVRTNLLGFGANGEPNYTDPANQIAAPNVRISDGATIVSAFDYTSYPRPIRKALEDDYFEAFNDWDQPGSEAAYTALQAAYTDGSIIDIG